VAQATGDGGQRRLDVGGILRDLGVGEAQRRQARRGMRLVP
jgi:hypothetical protein